MLHLIFDWCKNPVAWCHFELLTGTMKQCPSIQLIQVDLFLPLSEDPFLSSLIAGALLGIGSGIILRANGSSGGFDILGVVLNKKFRIPVSVVMYVCDCTVILLQQSPNRFCRLSTESS